MMLLQYQQLPTTMSSILLDWHWSWSWSDHYQIHCPYQQTNYKIAGHIQPWYPNRLTGSMFLLHLSSCQLIWHQLCTVKGCWQLLVHTYYGRWRTGTWLHVVSAYALQGYNQDLVSVSYLNSVETEFHFVIDLRFWLHDVQCPFSSFC